MHTAKSLFVVACLAGLIGTAWAAQRTDAPADALAPANDRVVQLERRIAELEARLEKLERTFASPAPVTANWTVPRSPSVQPQPLPAPDEREVNGVMFRFHLLGSESAPPVRR